MTDEHKLGTAVPKADPDKDEYRVFCFRGGERLNIDSMRTGVYGEKRIMIDVKHSCNDEAFT